jgi:hypothetical protein
MCAKFTPHLRRSYSSFFKKPHATIRAIDHQRQWGNVLAHDGASTDEGIPADCDAAKHHAARAEPNAVLDADWLGDMLEWRVLGEVETTGLDQNAL